MSGESKYEPDLDRALSLYREARSPADAVQERVWSAVGAAVSRPEAGDSGVPATPRGSGMGGKLAALAGVAAVGAAVWWMANAGGPPTQRQDTPSQAPATAPATTVRAPATRNEALATPAEQPAPNVPAPADEIEAPQPEKEPVAVPTARPAQASKPVSTLAAELRLMTAAQAALDAGQARHALHLLDRHRHRYPDGALAEEREAARVEALCGVGRTTAARRAAERFAVSFAGSPRIARVTSLCAEAAP